MPNSAKMRARRAVVLALAIFALVTPAGAAEGIANLWRQGRPVLDLRYRTELVDQTGLARNAYAHTLRLRAGYESGLFHGFGLGGDIEYIHAIGGESFNNTVNGKTRHPVVADPDEFELNRLYLISKGTIPDTTITVGRQRIVWGNARFVGNVGFRQNEQTFDAVRVVNGTLADTKVEFVFINRVHRIFGNVSPTGTHEMSSPLFRVIYSGLKKIGTFTAYGLLLDYDRAGEFGLSSQTYGLRFQGARAVGGKLTALYAVEFARQMDFARNGANFGHSYYLVEAGLARGPVSGRVGYEVLEGDGTAALQTPLATLHAFNGFTDRFLATPAAGLTDLYVKLAAKGPKDSALAGFKLALAYHEFQADANGADYGNEWSVALARAIATAHGTVIFSVKYADYTAKGFATDTTKLWLTAHYRY